jgi:protein-tyrosine-phosphatase/predicted ATP-grasp superfamily ATP-dependent carboligase
LLKTLLQFIHQHNIDTLMPCSDVGLQAIADHYNVLSEVVHPYWPSPSSIARVLDKDRTLDAATRAGVPIPHTFDILDVNALERMRFTLTYPLVAKPRDYDSRREFTAKYFTSYDDLRAEFDRDARFGIRNMIQEFCPGRGVGIAVLMHAGETLAMFQHIRVKEFPSAGGVSVIAESAPVDPVLAGSTRALLRELDWEGVAMVEFRRNDAGGRYALMEVNGRYWGSVGLALRCGVDFPYYDWQIAHGAAVHVKATYRTGIRARWLAEDIRRLVEVVLMRPADGSQPGRFREIIRFFKDYNTRTFSGIGSWSDPIPAAAEIFTVFGELVRGVSKRLIRRIAPAMYERVSRLRAIGYKGAVQHERRRIARALGRAARHFEPAGDVTSVLFICSGNIMRSPVASSLLSRALGDRANIAVESAGLHAMPGKIADSVARAVASEMGIDLRGHRAQLVSKDHVTNAEVIFVMDQVNEAEMVARYPEAASKVFLLATCRSGPHLGDLDIADPNGQSSDTMRHCFEWISRSVDYLADQLLTSQRARRENAGTDVVTYFAQPKR